MPDHFPNTTGESRTAPESAQTEISTPNLMTTCSRVVWIWLAATIPPVLLILIFGPPSHSGIMGYACAMIGFHSGLAAWLGMVGARARRWWITILGAIPLAVAPHAVTVIDAIATGVATPTSALANTDLQGAVWFTFLLTLAAAIFGHWTKAVSMRPPRGLRCDRCDYNLTGNVSGKCPECGTRVNDDKVLL